METSTSGIFATVMFDDISQLGKMKKLTKEYVLKTNRSAHISFEQDGLTDKEAGKNAHVHVLLITPTPKRDGDFIKRHFGVVSNDIVITNKTPYLMGDTIFRYLKGFKKEYLTSPGMKKVTQKWVETNQLEPIKTRGVEKRIRDALSLKDYRQILQRARQYAV